MAESSREILPQRFAHITAAELDVLLEAPESINSRQHHQHSVNILSDDARPSSTRPKPRPRPGFRPASHRPPPMQADHSTSIDDTQQRFAPISTTELNELLEASDSINTKRQIKYAVTILSDYAVSIGSSLAEVEALSAKDSNSFLAKFYATLRRHDGSLYTQKSMHGIKFGLQRHFQEVHGWDISRDKNFKESNRVFRAILLKLKQAGLDVVQYKSFITDSDLLKIKTSQALNINTPLGLQNKVFVDITMNLCNRGRHNFCYMKKEDFILQTDNVGFRYIIHKDQLKRNNRGDDGTGVCERLYEEPGNGHCPLQAFLKYTSKLHPMCLAFWQTPKEVAPEDVEPWYAGVPIGVNILSGKTRQISIAAGCSRLYSNQCLRSTGMNWQLNRSGESSVSNFNQHSITRSLQASSTDVQVKQEVKVIDETLDPMGYLKESVSNISTTPDLNGEEYIGHDMILTNDVLPDEEDWSNSDMSSVVLVEDDEDHYQTDVNDVLGDRAQGGVNEILDDSGQGSAHEVLGDRREGVGTSNNSHTTTVDLTNKDEVKTRKNRFNLMAEGKFKDFVNSVDAKKTKETAKFGMGVFQAYLETRGMDLETALADENLDEIIARFYPSARTKEGDYYSKNSITLIRFSLAKFVMKLKNVDISDCSQFPKACMSFKAAVKNLIREGKADIKHHQPISDEDMRKIQASLNVDNNVGLQRKVFIDVMLYFCSRGPETLRLMKPGDLIFQKSDDGREYIELRDKETKSYKVDKAGQIFEIPGHPRCPVKTLKKYLSKLNPARDVLFQRPETKYLKNSPTWYDKVLGSGKLRTLMKVISKEAGCETIYTNHCLHATTISKLHSLGYASRDVMTVSSNSAEISIKQYSGTSIEGMAIAAETLCPQNDSSDALSDDEDTAEEREERGIKRPFKRLTERHFVAVNKGRTLLGQPSKPQCIVCSNPAVKRHRTEFICEQCILPMCPAPCFKRYHTMADNYKTTCSDAYHMC